MFLHWRVVTIACAQRMLWQSQKHIFAHYWSQVEAILFHRQGVFAKNRDEPFPVQTNLFLKKHKTARAGKLKSLFDFSSQKKIVPASFSAKIISNPRCRMHQCISCIHRQTVQTKRTAICFRRFCEMFEINMKRHRCEMICLFQSIEMLNLILNPMLNLILNLILNTRHSMHLELLLAQAHRSFRRARQSL